MTKVNKMIGLELRCKTDRESSFKSRCGQILAPPSLYAVQNVLT